MEETNVIYLPTLDRVLQKGDEKLTLVFAQRSMKVVATSAKAYEYVGRNINALTLELLMKGYKMKGIKDHEPQNN